MVKNNLRRGAMKSKKSITWILVAVLVLVLAAGGYYAYAQNKASADVVASVDTAGSTSA